MFVYVTHPTCISDLTVYVNLGNHEMLGCKLAFTKVKFPLKRRLSTCTVVPPGGRPLVFPRVRHEPVGTKRPGWTPSPPRPGGYQTTRVSSLSTATTTRVNPLPSMTRRVQDDQGKPPRRLCGDQTTPTPRNNTQPHSVFAWYSTSTM